MTPIFRLLKATAIPVIVLVTLATQGYAFFNDKQSTSETEDLRFFYEVFNKVKYEYVKDSNSKELIDAALRGMLNSLDPYSDFLDEKSFKEMQITTKGEFGGIGIEVIIENGVIKVVSPYEDGPAFRAGVRAGDYVIKINDKVVKNMSQFEAVDAMRGEPGTTVNIKVHKSDGRNVDYTIKREVIRIEPVKAQLIDDEQVAYIKLGDFSDKAAGIIANKYKTMSKKAGGHLKGVVLDLRWNPGGLLRQAVEVADLFLNRGTIVSIKGRDNEARQVYKARPKDITGGLPIIVLINKGSASASEIVAGALQDNKRALVVGVKSFGKGSVQSVIPVGKSAAIKLTTALYYTPKGTSIQDSGIIPDIEVVQTFLHTTKLKDSGDQVVESGKNVPTNGPTSRKGRHLKVGAKSKDLRDYQLIRAIDLIKAMALMRYSKGNY